jgi:outer membrane protein TolC
MLLQRLKMPRHMAAAIVTLCLGVIAASPAAHAADTTIELKTVGSAPVDTNAPLGMTEALKIALARSESLRSTKVEIEMSKLGEKDQWYRMFPKLNLVAAYDVPVIQESNSGTNYKESINISFSTGPYDPISAYIGHDASKLSVQLSELLHVIAIQEMLEKIGYAFIEINSTDEEIASRKELIAVMESLVKYTRGKLDAGTISTLEHRVADQRLALARLELSRAVRKRELTLRGLKQLIGLDRAENVVFNTPKIKEQLMQEQDLDRALEPELLLKRNLNLQAQTLRGKLLDYNVTLAQAEHIPKFSFGFRTPDPMSNQQGNLPYYASMQASLPLWAWGETLRATDRAKLKVQGQKIAGKLLLNKIQQTAEELRAAMEANAEAASIAQTKAELQKLDVVRKEIAYSAGSVTYDTLVSTREAAIRAQLDAVKAQHTLNENRLNMQVVTGSLIAEHVRVKYVELEKD